MNSRFLAIAQDRSIIHGIHHYCDEWCDYCPATARCLGFLCTEAFRKQHGRSKRDPTFASTAEALAFTRELCQIDGSPTEDLEAIAADPADPRFRTDDPLASTAWNYAVEAAFIFRTEAMALLAHGPSRAARPTDEEVVLWYHLRIYMKVVRALVSIGRAPSDARRVDDANGCAKLVLVSIDRSQSALVSLRAAGRSTEIDHLLATIGGLRAEVEEKFPGAPGYVRFGLDCPVA